MGKRKRGQRPPVVMPNERRQFQPKELVNTLDPTLRQNLQRLAAEAYRRKGRGVLIAEINHRLPTGVARVDYVGADELEQYTNLVHQIEQAPLIEVCRTYNPEVEHLILVLDFTPDLPGPQFWFELFPRLDGSADSSLSSG